MYINFPPYSVGKWAAFGAPSRREDPPGKPPGARSTRWPSVEEFTYTIRVHVRTPSQRASRWRTVCGAARADGRRVP